jgi:hypothetical protein
MPALSQLHIDRLEHPGPQNLSSVVHVLLAGDRDYAPHLLDFQSNKCLIQFGFGKLLDLTLRALGDASSVKTLVVIGPELLAPRVPRNLRGTPTWFLPQQASFSQNVYAALRWIQKNKPGSLAIFLTNDAPLLTGAELDGFASVVLQQSADVNVAVSRVAAKTLDDPLVREYSRSIVSLSDGLYMLANQVSLSESAIDLMVTLQALFDLRKQSQLGTKMRTLRFVLKAWPSIEAIAAWFRIALAKKAWMLAPTSRLLARMSIPLKQVELSLAALLGHGLRVRINEIPESLGCFDADTPQQLRELRKVIATSHKMHNEARAS